MIEIAIIGLGAWGLCVTERAVAVARISGTPIRIHVIEPGSIGGIPYHSAQPDYLILNNACGQLSLFAAAGDGYRPPYSLGLWEWAVESGYRWIDGRCVLSREGDAILPTEYLPRRVMGEYLKWCYKQVVSNLPPWVIVNRHRAAAVDIIQCDDTELVKLDDATSIAVHHVVITTGHTPNRPSGASGAAGFLTPAYPVSALNENVGAQETVAVAGMGLVAYDILAALTLGRGGQFHHRSDGELDYVPGGQEPRIHLYSRSGVPHCAKAISGIDATGEYEPILCGPDTISRIRAKRPCIDFRSDILPLIYMEMQARYYVTAASINGGAPAGHRLADELKIAWKDGTFANAADRLLEDFGRFDPAAHLFADEGAIYGSSGDYENHVYDLVQKDFDEATSANGSAVKAAQEVTRLLRDDLRSLIEFSGLSKKSYMDFEKNIKGRINRIEAGPPPLRSAQLLALMRSGTVRADLGPDPIIVPTPQHQHSISVQSTRLVHAHTVNSAKVIRGHLEMPSLARSASPLISRMYMKRRFTQVHYDGTPVGSVALSDGFHPLNEIGVPQIGISVLGVLTEGSRYFTHYLPSPKSRIRAVLDAQACIEDVIERHSRKAHAAVVRKLRNNEV